MTISGPPYSFKNILTSFTFALLLVCCDSVATEPASLKSPKLISDSNSTLAIALKSVTFKAEPFPLTATVPFSSDTRTRICIFAMELEFLPGEGAGTFSVDAQDGAGKRYVLKIERDLANLSMIVRLGSTFSAIVVTAM